MRLAPQLLYVLETRRELPMPLDEHGASSPNNIIDLPELNAISEHYGREFIPYPFFYNTPSPHATMTEELDYRNSVLSRYKLGELPFFREWFDSYLKADIWVEARVYCAATDTTSLVMTHRTGNSGYFSTQRLGDNFIEARSISPYDIGPAIARAAQLTKPGSRQAITLPGDSPVERSLTDPEDRQGFSVSVSKESDGRDITYVDTPTTAMGMAQSHWQPSRRWGYDTEKPFVKWVTIAADGDYVSTRDLSHWSPMTSESLTRRIDELIASDVKAVRAARGID